MAAHCARANNATFIRESGGAVPIPLTVNVKAGGAIIDSNNFNIATAKALLHDAGLGATLDGGLTKKSTGTLTLSGNSTYTGTTTIQGGTLALVSSTSNNNIGASTKILVGDSAANSAAVLDVTGITTAGGFTLGPAQILAGFGTVKGAATLASGSVLAPGNSIGTLTLDGTGVIAPLLTFASGASILDELDNPLLSDSVALIHGLAGDIAFNNNVVNFSDLSGGSLAAGQYTLFSADVASAYTGLTTDGSGNITGGLAIGTGLASYTASLQVVGNNIVVNVAPVPEPATAILAACGAVGLAICRRRRTKSLRIC